MKKFISSLKESKVSNFELLRILFIYSCIIVAFNMLNGYLNRKEARLDRKTAERLHKEKLYKIYSDCKRYNSLDQKQPSKE